MLLANDIAKPGLHMLHGVTSGAQMFAVAEAVAAAGTRPVIMACMSDRDATQLRTQLEFFLPDAETLFFPAWDCMPYDRVSPNVSITSQRLNTLASLILRSSKAKKPLVILTTINALIQKTLPRDVLQKAVIHVQKGSRLDSSAMQQTLIELGYTRVVKVMEAGEYAMRGDIVDVFVPGMNQGCRIDLFGDEVETIRAFDPLSQRSEGTLPSFTLQPAGEILLNQAAINTFRSNYRTTFGMPHRDDMLFEAISAGRHYPGAEHWLPLFYPRLDSLMDYAPDAVVLMDLQADSARKERLETIRDYFAARQGMQQKSGKSTGAAIYNPLPPEKLYLDEFSWERVLERISIIQLSPFTPENDTAGELSLGTRTARNFVAERKEGAKVFDALREYLTESARLHKALLFACASTGTRERFATLLSQHNVPTRMVETPKEALSLPDGVAGMAIFPLERGLETTKLRILSEQDILGERITRTTRRKKASEYFMAEAASLAEGDLIVHREHGIGRFEGLVTMEVEGIRRDCLKLIYADDAKLFIPVENIEIVSRYGSAGENENVPLDRLGSASWQSRKAKLRERILLAAEELLATAAERAIHTAPSYNPQPELYGEFTRRFPYAETEDQDNAIADVLADLSSGRPMDRLICGDVGFGKTEVALRAAAAVVFGEAEGEASKRPAQVAVIAPTTLLARQHYADFCKRFEGMPVTIRQLSRLVSAKKAKETQEELRAGKVDIVVGTHAILGKSVEFDNLGLVIVDEEQHFGVAQKEKLKSLRTSVHVLTLSATPIPRTLQLALAGVRELSLITTPPVDRLAVRTFVLPFDPLVLREAILRERHRGGQVFYVTPRIADLAELQVRIRELVPEARMAVAHGQMPPTELDTIMTDFYEGKYDILLSTTIVESGLDVPTANTLIVNRADRFGLSQLYQLRGRVGRGKIRAYAYFTLQHHRTLAGNALRRLEVMQSLDTLGAGFTVASHDMDIRGFGNLLGEEQSGHVREVGVELYQQMLEEAVDTARRKAKKAGKAQAAELDENTPDETWVPQINLGLSVLIPESYVGDLELRMGLYRRAGQLTSQEETEAFAAELIDRFGPLPEEVQHLLSVLHTKQLCRRAGIEKLDTGPKGITLTFREGSTAIAPEALLGFIARSGGRAKIRPENKMVILQEWKNSDERLKVVQKEVGILAGLAQPAAENAA
jgi:transcription-repair coupling factor (superfamily II helicase)